VNEQIAYLTAKLEEAEARNKVLASLVEQKAARVRMLQAEMFLIKAEKAR
jgi:hypothetical protein